MSLERRLSHLERDVGEALDAGLARPDPPDLAAAKAELVAVWEEVKDELQPIDDAEVRETDPLTLRWLTAADYRRLAQALRNLAARERR